MRCAGQECGGGPDSSGPRGLQQGRGQGGRGQRPGARREGRVAAGSGGGGPRAWRGLGIPAKALEVMGRSLGSGGPGARGSLPLCAAVVRCPVPAGLSEAPGPAAPAPPPSALPPPPTGPGPAPPAVPRGAPGHSLCKRLPSKASVSSPNRSAYLGTGPLSPLGGRERGRNRARGQDKDAERGSGRARLLAAVHPLVLQAGEGKRVGPQAPTALRPVGWLTLAPRECRAEMQEAGMAAASLLGALQQPSDLSRGSTVRGAAQETPSAAPSPGAGLGFFRGMKVGKAPFFSPTRVRMRWASCLHSHPANSLLILGRSPSHSSANLCVLVGGST